MENREVPSCSKRSSPANSLRSSKGPQSFRTLEQVLKIIILIKFYFIIALKYKYDDLHKDDVIFVRVKSAKSPFDFYIQRHTEDYDHFMERIQRYVASGADDLFTVNVKDPCIAFLETEKWYWNRAIVSNNNYILQCIYFILYCLGNKK